MPGGASFCEQVLELYEWRLAELNARISELQAQRRAVATRTEALRHGRAPAAAGVDPELVSG